MKARGKSRRAFWIRLLGLVALAAVWLPGAEAHTPQDVEIDARAAAFTYTAAWSAGSHGVALGPRGSASFSVGSTTGLWVEVWARGQAFEVRMDGGPPHRLSVPACHCFRVIGLANDLTLATHRVLLRNLAARPLQIRIWRAKPGARFRQVAVTSDAVSGSLPAGTLRSFEVVGTSQIQADVGETGAQFEVLLDDRWTGAAVDAPEGDSVARVSLAWGLTTGLHRVTIDVSFGTLELGTVILGARSGHPAIVDESSVGSTPLLAVYGDSIANGERTLGLTASSDGYADRIAKLRGWRLADVAVSGSSASCYGVQNVDSVIHVHPQVVIVAYGVNDMVPGADYSGCDPTLADFRAAMGVILLRLQQGLPGVPVYVDAILPTNQVDEARRATWNRALRQVAAIHSDPFVNPSPLLGPLDYADGLHPNNLGHARIAAFWNSVLGT